jgi:hypothetical protein
MHWKKNMRFGTFNVRTLQRRRNQVSGGGIRGVKDLPGVQEVRWEGEVYQISDNYTFFYGKGNINYHLGSGFFVHNRINPAIKRVEFVSDRMSYMTLKGSWCDIIIRNVLVPNEDKDDDIKDSFYEELEQVFHHSLGII